MKRFGHCSFAVLVIAMLVLSGCPDPTSTDPGIGDPGPGGGIIFYDDTIGYDFDEDSIIQADEKNLFSETALAGKRYLEAALNTWSGGTEDPTAEWGANGTDIPGLVNITLSDPDTLAGTVGNGAGNTSEIVTYLEGTETGRAAQLCAAYTGGSQTDWFLPSIGELTILYSENDTVSGFSDWDYWSSSEYDSAWAWYVTFPTVYYVSKYIKSYTFRVRPVRAF